MIIFDLIYGPWPARPRSFATLDVPTASLAVTESGIQATMRPPFSRLTGHYPWKYFTGGLAALRVLSLGEECETTRKIEFALGLAGPNRLEPAAHIEYKSRRTRDQVAFEESSTWCRDVEQMVDWGHKIARLCPNDSIAQDLRNLPSMPAIELDRYVMTQARWLS